MPLPNREITDANYRYKFQGQEKDTETGMEAFELRLWDGRLGRWQSPDPYGEFDSPYLGMGNNPIRLIDPDGGSTEPPTDYIDKNGNLLLRTDDGSNAVITVPDNKMEAFWSSVHSSDFGLDSRSWNFVMKKYLVGNWNQHMENVQSWYTTYEARRDAALFWQTGDYDHFSDAAWSHTNTYRKDILSWGVALSGSILAVQANATRGIVKTTTLNTYELEATHGLTHSKTAFAKLKADIKANGMTEPIKIVKHNGINYVVNGHHRLRAAKELGIREVPVQEVKLPYAGYKTVDDLLYSDH